MCPPPQKHTCIRTRTWRYGTPRHTAATLPPLVRVQVTYTVQAGSGPVASGIRTVIVEADCPAGETLCTTGSCSSESVLCAADLGNPLTPTTARGGSSWVDGSEQPQLAAPVNTPPRLALRMAYGFDHAVWINQGTPYLMCSPGQVRLLYLARAFCS
jgi:hypothetical protein